MKKEKLSKLTIIMMAMSLVSCAGLRRGTSSESRFEPGELVPFREAVEDEVVYFVVDSYEYSPAFGTNGNPAFRKETMSLDTFLSRDGKKSYGNFFWFMFKEDVTLTSYTVEINSSLSAPDDYFDHFYFVERDPNREYGSVKGKEQWNGNGGVFCQDRHKHELDSSSHLKATCELNQHFDIKKGKYYCFRVFPTLNNIGPMADDYYLPSERVTKEINEKYLPYEIYNFDLTLIKR